MKEQLEPIRTISEARASEMARSVFLRAGLDKLMFQLTRMLGQVRSYLNPQSDCSDIEPAF